MKGLIAVVLAAAFIVVATGLALSSFGDNNLVTAYFTSGSKMDQPPAFPRNSSSGGMDSITSSAVQVPVKDND